MKNYYLEINGTFIGGLAFLVAAPFADHSTTCLGIGLLIILLSISIKPNQVAEPEQMPAERPENTGGLKLPPGDYTLLQNIMNGESLGPDEHFTVTKSGEYIKRHP